MAILIAVALAWLCTVTSVARPAGVPDQMSPEAYADSLTVSLVTCWPGPEIYELYGHEAVRVRGEGRDSVWNYGVFDFRKPNFVYRFVKGETDYMVAGYPFAWFMPEYMARGSKVVEQDLNLTQEEAKEFLRLLQVNNLPQNREYRYNYVKDNCATRIHVLLDSAARARVIYPDSVAYGTFRDEMRSYNRNYPWYQFGIDLALGSGIDYDLKAKEEMFVPLEMMRMAEGARLADGRKLVKSTRVLYESVTDATLPPTPWYAGPLFWSWLVSLILVVISLVDLKRHRLTRWVYSVWFVLLGLAGTIVAFLVFISSHEATSPNVLIFWLNPLQLLAGICLWLRHLRIVALGVALYDVVALTVLLVVWPFQSQSANPAFFPLMGATLVLAVAYAIIAHKESYNNNGRISSTSGSKPRRKTTGRASVTTNRKRKAQAK